MSDSTITLTTAAMLGRYRAELIEAGITDPLELAELVREAAKLVIDGDGLIVKAD